MNPLLKVAMVLSFAMPFTAHAGESCEIYLNDAKKSSSTEIAVRSEALQAAQNPNFVTLLSRLPEDLKELMKSALIQKAGIITVGRSPRTSITSYSLDALMQLKVSGLMSEGEIRKVAEELLDHSLGFLRKRINGSQELLATFARLGQRLALPDHSTPESYGRSRVFTEKYNLNSFLEVHRLQSKNESPNTISLGIGLGQDFKIAKAMQDGERAKESILFMLVLGRYEDATKVAVELNDDAALIQIGMLSLSKYFLPTSAHYFYGNRLYDAIEALKQVQGPLRPKAQEILKDLAHTIASPEHIKEVAAYLGGERHKDLFSKGFGAPAPRTPEENMVVAEKSLLGYAVKSMRSTGTLFAAWQNHNHLIFINKVEDPEVQKDMQSWLKIMKEKQYEIGGFIDEIGLAQASISGGSPYTPAIREALAKEQQREISAAEYLKKYSLPSQDEAPPEIARQLILENYLRQNFFTQKVSRNNDISRAQYMVANGDGNNAINYILRAAVNSPQLPGSAQAPQANVPAQYLQR